MITIHGNHLTTWSLTPSLNTSSWSSARTWRYLLSIKRCRMFGAHEHLTLARSITHGNYNTCDFYSPIAYQMNLICVLIDLCFPDGEMAVMADNQKSNPCVKHWHMGLLRDQFIPSIPSVLMVVTPSLLLSLKQRKLTIPGTTSHHQTRAVFTVSLKFIRVILNTPPWCLRDVCVILPP